MESTESALEQFRAQWREEVQKKSIGKSNGKAKQVRNALTTSEEPEKAGLVRKSPQVAPVSTLPPDNLTEANEHKHQREDAEDNRADANKPSPGTTSKGVQPYVAQPKSALDHYERAVEREAAGNLGDSVSLYRQAFKLDDRVHESYKKKHYPTTAMPHSPASANQSMTSAPAKSSSTSKLGLAMPSSTDAPSTTESLPNTIDDLAATFANLSMLPSEPSTSLSEPLPCPVSSLPTELLHVILLHTTTQDPQTLPHLAQTCRVLAYHTSTHNPLLYRHILFSTPHGIQTRHYRYACDLIGTPLADLYSHTSQIKDLTPQIYPTYRSQYRHRPRIRFGGVYISTVNYTRPGGHSLTLNPDGSTSAGTTGSTVSKHTWSAASPVHIVTYYRYLRFWRDGSCVSLLSSAEPTEVVPVLLRENVPAWSSHSAGGKGGKEVRDAAATGAGVMKEALAGRWRITGAASGVAPLINVEEGEDDRSAGLGKRPGEYAKEPRLSAPSTTVAPQPTNKSHELVEQDPDPEPKEEEGTLHIETQGVVPRYLWKMQFAIGSTRKDTGFTTDAKQVYPDSGPTRNTRLAWRGFWSYNKLTDDWGEFGLKNDRSFYWRRVRAWGVGG